MVSGGGTMTNQGWKEQMRFFVTLTLVLAEAV